jgi:hypothetical protein
MVDYPDFMDVAIPIVGSPRLTGYDLLLWYNEESALKSDPAWQGGRYTKSPPLGAVQAIHQMNLTTPADYARIHPPDKFLSDYVGYLITGVLPFDANDWLAQLDAMIHHDVARGGKIEDAAKRVKAKVLVVAAAQDHMVNPKPALDFAALIGARTLVLDSDCGRHNLAEVGNAGEPAQHLRRSVTIQDAHRGAPRRHPDRAPSPCRRTHPRPAAARRSKPAPRRRPAPGAAEPTSGASAAAASASCCASGESFTSFAEPSANPFSSACRKIFLIRLNAAEIAAKSSDPRTAVSASARAIASRTSSRPGSQHGIHHVVSKPAHVLQIEMQPLRGRRRVTCLAICSFWAALLAWGVTTSASVSGNPDSARIFTIAFAARRSANGSFDPVGAAPMPNIAVIV